MKRVVAIVIIMAMVTSLFSFNVFGATNGYYFPIVVGDTSTNGNVRATLNVSKFIVNADSVITGGGQIPFLITVELWNSSTQDALVSLQQINITFDTTAQVSNYELFSTDMHIIPLTSSNTTTTPSLFVEPNNDFSYNGQIIVPAQSKLYAVTEIYIYSPFDSSTQSWGTPTLISCDINISSVTYGSYNHGNAVDFSSLIDALTGDDDISMSEIAELLEDVKSINSTAFSNIINLISYTGSTDITFPRIYNASRTFQLDDINNVTGNTLTWYMSSPCYDSIDYELDSTNDNIVFHYTYHRHVVIQVHFDAIENTSIDSGMRFLYYKFGNTSRGINNVSVTSNNMDYYRDTVNSVFLHTLYTEGSNRAVLIKGRNIFRLEYDLYFTDSDNDLVTPTSSSDIFYWSHNTVNTVVGDFKLNNTVIFNEINSKLNDLYNSLVKPANEDNTEEAQEMNDQIHDSEQVWYDNNSEALEQVGLSNYRFSTSQSNGITQAVTQFQAVWNALGDWTNVYIFILILSISTYIIRHEPTTRVKQYRSSVQAERAERISYYGRKNAESRASSSGSTLKSVIRRRK